MMNTLSILDRHSPRVHCWKGRTLWVSVCACTWEPVIRSTCSYSDGRPAVRMSTSVCIWAPVCLSLCTVLLGDVWDPKCASHPVSMRQCVHQTRNDCTRPLRRDTVRVWAVWECLREGRRRRVTGPSEAIFCTSYVCSLWGEIEKH